MLVGKRIAILVDDDFEDAEIIEPRRAMKEAGARVVIVGSGDKQSYHGKHGANIVIDKPIDKVKAGNFDAIIIPGGHAPDKLRLHQSMIDFVKQAYEAGKLIAAICHGPQLLISADIIRERRVTSCPSIAVDLRNAGAIWVNEPVVRDGTIITSRKPADLPKFEKEISEAFF